MVPPAGVEIDAIKRPFVIVDPRAGHGPGIGGFKPQSEVGVAFKAGHPCYFIGFLPDPVPGQTIEDIAHAEAAFLERVIALHPQAEGKPAVVGNCQAGWAVMLLAAMRPDLFGPIILAGSPLSYWAGVHGQNPMRYTGGLLGGSWPVAMMGDLGNGEFDGAWIVSNFENLNPSNTLWTKHYNLYSKIDTEAPRYLEFERWWGGFYLMNREEIEWITQNLFVGNKLWSGDTKAKGGKAFDLRDIKSPIILFASMGDNITPPQQAFNWVADIYGSTEEIKARGQVIVGLMHENIGHLGIFVSGKVAKKEHTQIVSVMKSVEMLPPGLYAMKIETTTDADGKEEHTVEFEERRLEDITAHFNRFQRNDEKPFEAVAAVSEFNQHAYELFAQPAVKAMSNDATAKLRRDFHPLRFQRWALSDLNPWLAWVAPVAQQVRAQRKAVPGDAPSRKVEAAMAELVSASLDHYRALRDAASEAKFFTTFGNMFSLYLADKHVADERAAATTSEPRELPFVKEALASIKEGGYTEAFARVAYLLARKDDSLPLSRLVMRQELAKEYSDLLPSLAPDQWRRVRGEQEIIARYEPEQSIATLPDLLKHPADRERLLMLMERVLADKRIQADKPSAEQMAMLERIREVLHDKSGGARRRMKAV
jgi:pimeloyl-ACP methyl ester carboxylesterase